MKKRLIQSVVATSLLLGSGAIFAKSLDDLKAVNFNQEKTKAAVNASHEEDVDENRFVSFLNKVDNKNFEKEINQHETQRFKDVLRKEVKRHKKALAKAPKEFMSGLNNVILTLHAIRSNKINEAKKLLKKSDADFNVAFKENPKLNLIPVTDTASVVSFNGDVKLIKWIKKSAIKLLEKNETQLAIDILTPLQDELTLTTQQVPAYLYPVAVKQAVKDLSAGKKDAASATLTDVLNLTQINTVIIPIPLLTAEGMIVEASKLNKSHKKEVTRLLNMAQEELQKAVLLGYTHKHSADYRDINKQIEAIKHGVKGNNMIEKYYDKLLNSFKTLEKKHEADVKVKKINK